MKCSVAKTLILIIGMICVAVLFTASARGQLLPPFPYHAVPVRIVSENSGKCLRIRGGDLQNHARAEQYNCDYSNDWWLVPAGPNYYRVIASHSGANLDLRTDTNALQQYGINNGKNQQWEFRYVYMDAASRPVYEIRSRYSGQCVDVAWGSKADGADVNQYSCQSSSNQRWRLDPRLENRSVLLAKHSNKCLDTVPDGTNHLQQYNCHGDANQRWTFVPGPTVGGATYYTIRSAKTGRCLDVAWGSLDDHAAVNEYSCHSGDNQLWQVRPLRDDYFAIVNKRSGKCLDIEGASTADQAKAQQYSCRTDGMTGLAAANQSFRISAFAERRIQLVQVARDDGSGLATIDDSDMKLLVDRVNITYAPVGVRLVYDGAVDKVNIDSTAIYNLGDDKNKYYCKQTGSDLLPEQCVNAVADRYWGWGKLVIFVRPGNGFSSERMKFIVLGEYAGKSCPADDTWLAHELGHHLGLHHTFVESADKAGADKLLQQAGNDINAAFDGDGLSDTPPTPSWKGIERTNCSSSSPYFWLSLNGTDRTYPVMVWVNDPMSYYYYVPKRVSPQQGAVIRALMNVRGWN